MMPNANMQPGPAAFAISKEFEGYLPRGYLCPEGVPTAGWGHTGPEVRVGVLYSREQCEEWLQADLKEHGDAVAASVRVKLTQGQFDALVSFSFNVGSGWITGKGHKQATFMKRLNAGDYECVPAELLRFSRGANSGKHYDGLRRRRAAEGVLWTTGRAVNVPGDTDEPMPQKVDAPRRKFEPSRSGTVWGAVLAALGGLAQWLGSIPDVVNEALSAHDLASKALGLVGTSLPYLGAGALIIGLIIVIDRRRTAALEGKIG